MGEHNTVHQHFILSLQLPSSKASVKPIWMVCLTRNSFSPRAELLATCGNATRRRPAVIATTGDQWLRWYRRTQTLPIRLPLQPGLSSGALRKPIAVRNLPTTVCGAGGVLNLPGKGRKRESAQGDCSGVKRVLDTETGYLLILIMQMTWRWRVISPVKPGWAYSLNHASNR